jgi:CRP-like cAMP-binding protein
MKPTELKIVTVFESTEAFQNLDILHIHKLASVATETEFEEGEIIHHAGDAGKAIYLIQAGEVAVEMDVVDYGLIRLFTLGPGHLFGWSSLFPTRRKQARIRVLQSTQAIAINASQLRDLFQADHKLEQAVMNCMTQAVLDRARLSY